MSDFNIGDSVRHVAGGPDMKISKFGVENIGSPYIKLGRETPDYKMVEDKSNALCYWWDGKKNETIYQWYPVSDLIKID